MHKTRLTQNKQNTQVIQNKNTKGRKRKKKVIESL